MPGRCRDHDEDGEDEVEDENEDEEVEVQEASGFSLDIHVVGQDLSSERAAIGLC